MDYTCPKCGQAMVWAPLQEPPMPEVEGPPQGLAPRGATARWTCPACEYHFWEAMPYRVQWMNVPPIPCWLGMRLPRRYRQMEWGLRDSDAPTIEPPAAYRREIRRRIRIIQQYAPVADKARQEARRLASGYALHSDTEVLAAAARGLMREYGIVRVFGTNVHKSGTT